MLQYFQMMQSGSAKWDNKFSFSHRWDLQPDLSFFSPSWHRSQKLVSASASFPPRLQTSEESVPPLLRHQQKSFFPAHSFSSSKRAAANAPWNLPFPFHLALTERCSSCCRWLTQLLQGLVDDLVRGADLRARGGKHKRSTHLCVCIWIISADKHRPWRKQELASVCPFGPHGGIILGVLTQNDTSLILLPVLVVCEV